MYVHDGLRFFFFFWFWNYCCCFFVCPIIATAACRSALPSSTPGLFSSSLFLQHSGCIVSFVVFDVQHTEQRSLQLFLLLLFFFYYIVPKNSQCTPSPVRSIRKHAHTHSCKARLLFLLFLLQGTAVCGSVADVVVFAGLGSLVDSWK